jgi:hypothetical protein
LKNDKYQRPQTAIRKGEDWISLLSTESGAKTPKTFNRKNTLRSSTVRFEEMNEEMLTTKTKLLKFEKGTKFHFP